MKQKLSLVCALVPQPHVLLLDEPTTGVDPVSRREFWDVLAHLAADGLTILVATPYLDEAERCHRVALMHLGEIQQMGTPAELRSRLHAKRLELRTAKSGRSGTHSHCRERTRREAHRRAAVRRSPRHSGAPIRMRRTRVVKAAHGRGEPADRRAVHRSAHARKHVRRHAARLGAGDARRALSGPSRSRRTCAARSPSAPTI